MPEIGFSVQWPDGARSHCISPSTALRRHLESRIYELDVFLELARSGFAAASERVREVYGFPCSRAAAQLRAIEEKAAPWRTAPQARVRVEFD